MAVVPSPALPSAADLDAIACEEIIRERTGVAALSDIANLEKALAQFRFKDGDICFFDAKQIDPESFATLPPLDSDTRVVFIPIQPQAGRSVRDCIFQMTRNELETLVKVASKP